MNEGDQNAGDGEARSTHDPGDDAPERPRLVPLLAMIRTDRAAHPSALPMVIRSITPAVRAIIRKRTRGTGVDSAFTEDVLQDALLRVVLHAHKCQAATERAAMQWLLRTARSAIIEALRGEGPWRLSLDHERPPSLPPQSYVESVGQRDVLPPEAELLLRLVVDASRALSPEDATLLWMRVIADEEWAVIGATFGITATAARRRFQRAQQAMRANVYRALAAQPPAARDAASAWLHRRLGKDVHDSE